MTTTTNNMNSISTIVNNVLNKVDAWTRITLVNACKYMERTGFASYPVEIPLDKLSIPEFQRKLNPTIVNKMVKDFNPLLVEYIVVNFDPETLKLDCLDGQHTALGLEEKGYHTAQARLFIGLTDEQKATIFATQYKKKNRLTPVDEFHVYRWAGMEPAKTIDKVSTEFKVIVGGTRGEVRTITSIRKLNQIVKKYGEDGLRFCYKVIEDSGWTCDPKAYTEAVLNIGYFAYPLCGNDKAKYDLLISMLNQFVTCTEFIDYVRFEHKEISAKHPEYGVRLTIEAVLK